MEMCNAYIIEGMGVLWSNPWSLDLTIYTGKKMLAKYFLAQYMLLGIKRSICMLKGYT